MSIKFGPFVRTVRIRNGVTSFTQAWNNNARDEEKHWRLFYT